MPTQTTQPARSPAADNPFEQFQWKPQPEAERLVRELVDGFLKHSPFAAMLRDRMYAEAGVRLLDLVDYIAVPASGDVERRLFASGYHRNELRHSEYLCSFTQDHGIFPTVLFREPTYSLEVGLKVESVIDFASTWQAAVQGPEPCVAGRIGEPLGRIRNQVIDIGVEEPEQLATTCAIERHGYRGFDLAQPPPRLDLVMLHSEYFRLRRRCYPDEETVFSSAAHLIDRAAAALGLDYACDLFFAAEREYWQRRNRAAQVQKARQDRLGIGWANHDHHTYRSSRKHFARLISVFEKLGFHCRERFYAGRQAGWGAQVLEQPNAGIVIFADVDLSPDELLIDFAHEPLPERQQLGTVGLWCALHGESFLEAGMHHLECQFDFEALRTQLEIEAGIRTMKPFTDFPYLRQAFTEGERWPVREQRIQKLLERGQITPEQAEAFRTQGAIGSHLENLERNEGFKGFNQTGVSEIIAATDPRKHVRG